MKRMTWKTFERKLDNGDFVATAWSEDGTCVEVIVEMKNGSRKRERYEITGKREGS